MCDWTPPIKRQHDTMIETDTHRIVRTHTGKYVVWVFKPVHTSLGVFGTKEEAKAAA